MALTPRNNKRKTKKRETEVLEQVGEGIFLGLDFISKMSDITDTEEALTESPNVHFKDSSVILDYGHLTSNTRNKTNREELELFFQSTVLQGDTVTITNGEYINELTGDSSTYDIGGTYTFVSFNVNNLIVVLKKTTVNNQSLTYNDYNKNYFINGSLRWTTASTVDDSKVELINEIINRMGYQSVNSFRSNFGLIKTGDILELLIDKTTVSSFTVKNYYKDDDNIEHVEVEETVPTDINMFSTEVFCRLKRIKQKDKPSVSPSTRCREGEHWMPPVNGKSGFCMEGERHGDVSSPRTSTPRRSGRSGY